MPKIASEDAAFCGRSLPSYGNSLSPAHLCMAGGLALVAVFMLVAMVCVQMGIWDAHGWLRVMMGVAMAAGNIALIIEGLRRAQAARPTRASQGALGSMFRRDLCRLRGPAGEHPCEDCRDQALCEDQVERSLQFVDALRTLAERRA